MICFTPAMATGLLLTVAILPRASGQPIPIPFGDELPAWLKAGAKPGWMGRFIGDIVRFDLRFRPNRDYVPAMRFYEAPEANLSKLPAPKGPFGIDLHDCKIGDTKLKELTGFKNLVAIRLTNTQVTDAGMPHLIKLKELHTLDLGRTRLTDSGLKQLSALKKLKRLLVDNTKVSAKGVKQLKQALPGCRVIGPGGDKAVPNP